MRTRLLPGATVIARAPRAARLVLAAVLAGAGGGCADFVTVDNPNVVNEDGIDPVRDADVLSRSAFQDFATANGLTTGLSGGSGKVVVGAANFAESETLAELYRIALTAAGFQASVLKSTNREVYEPAIEKGDISVFPEHAATLTEFLNQKKNGKSAAAIASGDINTTISKLTPLATEYGLVVGKPSTASDQNAFAVTKPVADQYQLKTLSDFAAKCSGPASVLAGPAECPQRPFCQVGLNSTYKITFGSFFQADAGGPLSKTALKTGKATLGLVFSSDSSLTAA